MSLPDAALPAAALAGTVAIGVTLAIERLGGRLGGLIGTLPTTIVPASLGIWAESTSTVDFAAAMDATPPGMLLNALFLWLWRVLPGRLPTMGLGARLTLMSAIALMAWLTAAVALVVGSRAWLAAGQPSLALGIGGLVLLVGVGLLACRNLPPAPRGHRRVGPGTLLARGIFAGCAIAVAVVVAAQGNALAAGVVSVFPAIFLTTMVALWLAQGEAVPAGAVGPMMLGASSVAGFSLYARFLFPELGPALGATVAWVAAALTTTLPAWWWLVRRRG